MLASMDKYPFLQAVKPGCFEQFGTIQSPRSTGYDSSMAHVGQELAFGFTGGFRLFFLPVAGLLSTRFAVGDILYVTVPQDIST